MATAPIIRHRRLLHLAWLLPVLSLLAGCAGYRAGSASLYPAGIRTVYVPMFASASFRLHLGERLTEAVIKEIELKTPYKVVNHPNADTVLRGTLTNDTKRVTVESPFDDPRQVEYGLIVEVSWVDRQTGQMLEQGALPIPAAVVSLDQSAKFTPEVGQSVATAQQAAIQKMAEQIVGMMEAPW